MSDPELIKHIIETAKIHGISQAELAERAGIRPETLSRAKRNPNISLSTFAKLAHIAGLRLQLIPDHPVAEQINNRTLFPS